VLLLLPCGVMAFARLRVAAQAKPRKAKGAPPAGTKPKKAGGFGARKEKAAATPKEALAAAERSWDKMAKAGTPSQLFVVSARSSAPSAPPALSDWLPVAELAVADEVVGEVGGLQAALAALAGPLAPAAPECVSRALRGTPGGAGAGDAAELAVETWDSYQAAMSAARAAEEASDRRRALAVLGLPPDEEPERAAIKSAYRKEMAKSHPDRNPGDEAAAARYAAVLAAYETLAGEVLDVGGSGYEALAVGGGMRDHSKLAEHAAKGGSKEADVPAGMCGIRALVNEEVLIFRSRNATAGAGAAEPAAAGVP